MAIRKSSELTKKQILSVCVRLFLEQGYHDTTVKQITEEAGVSIGQFQNLFRSKEGVLTELIKSMFSGQFGAARSLAGKELPPVYTYAAETAIQLVITERNEHLREIYVEAYSRPATVNLIHKSTAHELKEIFGANFPGYDETDFYELDIGTAGIMRGYMTTKCDEIFTMERKIHRFLSDVLRIYNVPGDKIERTLAFVDTLDITAVADNVLKQLFTMLEMQFDFKLSDD